MILFVNFILAYFLINTDLFMIKFIYIIILLIFSLRSLELEIFNEMTIEQVYDNLMKRKTKKNDK